MSDGPSEQTRPVIMAFLILFLIAFIVMGFLQWRIPEANRPQPAPLPSLEEYFESAAPEQDPFDALSAVTLGEEGFVNQELQGLTRDGEFLNMRVSKPEGVGPFPVIVLVHGIDSSSQITNQVSLQYGEKFSNELGAIVVVVDWRDGVLGEEDYIDVISAVDWAQNVEEKGSQPVVLFGVDHGAYLSVKATSEVEVDGVVSAYGFVDLLEQYNYLKEYNADTAEIFLAKTGCQSVIDVDGCLRQLSIRDTVTVEVPLLIIHGADDSITPPAQSEFLRDSTDEAYVRYELLDGATEEEFVQRVFDDTTVAGHDAAIDILYDWLSEELNITPNL